MSGVYVDWTESVRCECHHTRISYSLEVSPYFPVPLGAEIGRLDRTATTNVLFVIFMQPILLLLLAAAACI